MMVNFLNSMRYSREKPFYCLLWADWLTVQLKASDYYLLSSIDVCWHKGRYQSAASLETILWLAF